MAQLLSRVWNPSRWGGAEFGRFCRFAHRAEKLAKYSAKPKAKKKN